MALLDQETKNALTQYLTQLAGPVELVTALDDSERGRQLAELVQELVAAGGGKVTVREAVGEEVAGGRRPAFAVTRPGEAPRGAFRRLAAGARVRLAHSRAAAGERLPAQARAGGDRAGQEPGVAALFRGVRVAVVPQLPGGGAVGQTCSAAQIEGAGGDDRQGELPRRGRGQGRSWPCPPSISTASSSAKDAWSCRRSSPRSTRRPKRASGQKLSQKGEFDILIVGGGSAGAAAAIYTARKGLRTGIVAERFGGQVMDTLAIENFISVKGPRGPKLVAGLEEHVKAYDVDIMNHQRAVRLDVPAEPGKTAKVALANDAELGAKAVILATGARWRELGVPGEKNTAAGAWPTARTATDRSSRARKWR